MPKSAAARSTHPGRWGHPDVCTASREEKRLRIKIPRRRHLSGLGRENPILFHLSRGLYSPSYKRGQLQELYQHTQQRDSGKNLSWGALPLPPPHPRTTTHFTVGLLSLILPQEDQPGGVGGSQDPTSSPSLSRQHVGDRSSGQASQRDPNLREHPSEPRGGGCPACSAHWQRGSGQPCNPRLRLHVRPWACLQGPAGRGPHPQVRVTKERVAPGEEKWQRKG